MTIEFEPGHDIDTQGERVALAAVADGSWVFCVIPFDTLKEVFGAEEGDDPGAVAEDNRAEIESLARSLIEAGLVSANQEALLSAGAIARLRQSSPTNESREA